MEPIIKPYQGKFSSILLFGPPGAGKATLGKFLTDSGSQYHLESGEIFRSLPASSPAGELYYHYARRGALIPDEATLEIWKYYVLGLIATNTFHPDYQDLLLDGIPRTVKQAEMLQEHVQVKHIIVLEVPNSDELVTRLQHRARKEGKMEEMDPQTIIKKLDTYREEIQKVIHYYPPHLVSRVNGDQKPLEVLRDVLVRLSHLLSKTPPKSTKMGTLEPGI